MEKLKMHSPDFTQDNIARIRELFPGCVTEAKAEDGSIKLAVDFDQLRQELSGSLVEGPQERYHLNWPGKREALLAANAPIAKTLRPCREESVDFDTTKNLFIEGDNLEALKLLQETFLGKVKMIYIDPPYNTGKDFIYEDDYSKDTESYLIESNQVDKQGVRLVTNTEANGRFHSDWLSMIYARLRIARNLLKDDGVIFISIDDNEVANLRRTCDEVFGEENFLGQIAWKKKTNGNNMGAIPPVHDYIVVYGKKEVDSSKIGYPITKEYIEENYSNPDNDPRGAWTTMDLSANHKGPYFAIKNPKTGEEHFPSEGRYWVFNEEEVLKRISEGRIIFGKSGSARPVQKVFAAERIAGKIRAESWWDNHGMNEDATNEIRDLFGRGKLFTHPKPSRLLYNLVKIASSESDIIVDFFAGSSTTAHAMLKLNAEDGGNRRFIMVQLPEVTEEKSEAFKAGYKTIAEISKERIRRAGKKILEGECHENWNQDIGFRVLKIDTSNLADVYYTPDALDKANLDLFADNIKPDRTPEDLLFQVMLDWGVDLALPIGREIVKSENGKVKFEPVGADDFTLHSSPFTIFTVDENALIACFDNTGSIDEAFVKELAKRQPLRVVFRDAGFKSDDVKINVEQIFKLISPVTEVKCL